MELGQFEQQATKSELLSILRDYKPNVSENRLGFVDIYVSEMPPDDIKAAAECVRPTGVIFLYHVRPAK